MRLRLEPALIGAVLFLACMLAPELAADTDLLRSQGLATEPVRVGDRCLVSGILLDSTGVVFVYRGRRVSLHQDAVGIFLKEPDVFFSKLQPRGALFQEDESFSLGLSWLFLGIWVSLGLICGAVSSHLALKRGRSAGFWFAAGLMLNIIALVTLLSRPSDDSRTLPERLGKIHQTSDPAACPSCQAPNHQTARLCSFCGGRLEPTLESETQRISRE